jgi:hypothetical protein
VDYKNAKFSSNTQKVCRKFLNLYEIVELDV